MSSTVILAFLVLVAIHYARAQNLSYPGSPCWTPEYSSDCSACGVCKVNATGYQYCECRGECAAASCEYRRKSYQAVCLTSVFVGGLGVHRFLLELTGSGVARIMFLLCICIVPAILFGLMVCLCGDSDIKVCSGIGCIIIIVVIFIVAGNLAWGIYDIVKCCSNQLADANGYIPGPWNY
jgi:hypothetical protein